MTVEVTKLVWTAPAYVFVTTFLVFLGHLGCLRLSLGVSIEEGFGSVNRAMVGRYFDIFLGPGLCLFVLLCFTFFKTKTMHLVIVV